MGCQEREGGGKKNDKKKIIESIGCQEGGGGEKIAKKTIIESKGCQEGGGRGRKKLDKNKIIESMGCQEGGKMLIKRKSLKARVAKKGGRKNS